ncbi:MAG: chemotaxis protein CheX [Candidatus Omnitrophica bacterium]|nr:chemotaxis protein CheX [Candidatus Omnitrophota bacterium]
MFDHKTLFPDILQTAVTEGFGSVYSQPRPAANDENLYGLEGIFSTIYLKGDLVGKISMFIRASSAARVVGAMLDRSDLEEESHDTLDGIGEVLNMVVGCFKKHLEPHKVSFEISVPSTRLTGVIPPSRWENNIEQVFAAGDVYFRMSVSYRLANREDQAAVPPPTPKPKLSAAELLKLAMSKKK